MGWEKKGGGDLEVTACPGFSETCQDYSCSSPGPMDSAAQNARAEGVDTAAGQRDKVPPRPLADPNDQR